MGKRNSKPTKLKVLEGNRGRRKLPDEPKPRPVVPDPPGWMDTRAKKLWRNLAPKIERLGLLTEIDIEAFTAMCQTWARLETIWRRLKKLERELRKTEGDDSKKELAFFMKEERLYSQVFRMQAAEFGLSPRGRAGLSVNTMDPEEGSDLLT